MDDWGDQTIGFCNAIEEMCLQNIKTAIRSGWHDCKRGKCLTDGIDCCVSKESIDYYIKGYEMAKSDNLEVLISANT